MSESSTEPSIYRSTPTSSLGASSTKITDETKFRSNTDFNLWGRVVKVAIFDRGGYNDSQSASSGFEFDGKYFDISFNFDCKVSDGNQESYGTGSITFKNLNHDTQWGIKQMMGITITAGYESAGSNGIVFSGIITNIHDKYSNDGSVTLELDIQANYPYESTIVRTDPIPKETPFKDVIEMVCNQSGIPLNRCDIEGDEFVTDTERTFTGTTREIVGDLVNAANAILVKTGQKTEQDIAECKGFSIAIDANYLEIISYDMQDEMSALEFSAETGLINVERADILNESFSTNTDDVTMDCTIMFNHHIRLNTYVSIISTKQPHLNGIYIVQSYSMEGSSRDGSHQVKMGLFPVQGATNSIVDLQSMYRLNYEVPPSSDD